MTVAELNRVRKFVDGQNDGRCDCAKCEDARREDAVAVLAMLDRELARVEWGLFGDVAAWSAGPDDLMCFCPSQEEAMRNLINVRNSLAKPETHTLTVKYRLPAGEWTEVEA